MAISMPDRNHVAALITTFNQTSQSLQGWQDKITTATVALVEHAHALHDAEVAAALAATPVPTVVATGKPVNTALTAASFYALFEDIGLAGTAPTATSLNPFAALAETDSAATNGPDAFTAMMNRVAGIDFHSSLLTAHLRGWQAFGVRYALAQRRILLGDEMGLGKTLEALGVITARLAQGDTHALVVAPIGVLANW